jgi:hypothetical protein
MYFLDYLSSTIVRVTPAMRAPTERSWRIPSMTDPLRLLFQRAGWGLRLSLGAGDEIRTHDPYLGKVMLYP